RRYELRPQLHTSLLLAITLTYTRSIHTRPLRDALPTSNQRRRGLRGTALLALAALKPKRIVNPQNSSEVSLRAAQLEEKLRKSLDRKSTRLNSSHVAISYAAFSLKKKLTVCQISISLDK